MTATAKAARLISGRNSSRFKATPLSPNQMHDRRNAVLDSAGQNGRVDTDQHDQNHEGGHVQLVHAVGVVSRH